MGRIVKVECHSGYTYAERPVAVELDGARMEIKKIISEKRTPSGRSFTVKIIEERILELDYDENLNIWRIESRE